MAMFYRVLFFICLTGIFLPSCKRESSSAERSRELLLSQKKDDVLKVEGENDSIPSEDIQKGEVLIAYSDCYTCHKTDKKAKGPAFRDIAERYPRNQVFIKMLAHRVITGGSGAWGYSVMSPHPDIRPEDAELMVSYILSLDL